MKTYLLIVDLVGYPLSLLGHFLAVLERFFGVACSDVDILSLAVASLLWEVGLGNFESRTH